MVVKLATKHIGILACSAEGAALCYRTICGEAPALLGPYMHPEVTMHTYPLGAYMVPLEENGNDWSSVSEIMYASCQKLEATGVDIIVCPDNTIHVAYDKVAPRVKPLWLHIAQVVTDEAKVKGYKKIGVMGTKFLMEGPVYPSKLEPAGLAYLVPTVEQRERINQIIFDELVNAKFTKESLSYFVTVIEDLKSKGCDAVVLGCTEIPLLVSPQDSPIPTLDSTRLLARAAIRAAIA
jgi:aspartate racemase